MDQKGFANMALVVLVGVAVRVEVWNKDIWEKYKKRTESEGEKTAEKLTGAI